jgi:hypothetical protein
MKSNGSLALLAGSDEVMTTAIDPVSSGYSNGLIKMVNSGSQAGNMSARMDLIINPSGDPANMGKAASLGDIELLLDVAKVEIGNRVWADLNTNGIQGANEPGIAGVVVLLRSPGVDNACNTGDDQTWTVVTDANGNYYFDETIVNDNRKPSSWIGISSSQSGILPGFEYRLEISLAQAALTDFYLTIVNAPGDEINSKGVKSGSTIYHVINPGGPAATGSKFENDYNIDIGFTNIPLPLTLVSFNARLVNNDQVDLKWTTVSELNVSHFVVEKSTEGRIFAEAGIVLARGNTTDVTNYNFVDKINASQAGLIYYRLRSVDIDENYKYSEIRIIRIGTQTEKDILIIAYPNPVTNELRVTIPTNWQNKKVTYELFNANGQASQKSETASSNQTETLNVSSLAPGFYIVRVTCNGETAQQKIIKQ